jgi:hypothetical protein
MTTPAIQVETDFEALAARLAARAGTLAVAHTTALLLAARRDARTDALRWRRADLVWPLFAKG